MLTHRNTTVITLLIGTLWFSNSVSADEADADFPEGRDHPKIPRVAGTTILGFAESSFDEGVFMTAAVDKEIEVTNVEGKRTRIMYVAPKSLSPLGILRNYQQAFKELGEVEEVYSCKGDDCFRNLGKVFVWRESNLIANNLGSNKGFIFGFGSSDSGRNYWYGKVKTPEAHYHISVSAAVMTYSSGGNVISKIENHPVIHLEIVEIADFKANLEVVTAQDMTDKINQKGHIALYGIHFDFDSDKLKAESDPTLEQIAKVMMDDSKLNIYVVGHTDNKGKLEYNKELSNRRATAVVENLASVHGIASERMVAIGVGPAAPISTNKTDDGRALNRRVELVER